MVSGARVVFGVGFVVVTTGIVGGLVVASVVPAVVGGRAVVTGFGASGLVLGASWAPPPIPPFAGGAGGFVVGVVGVVGGSVVFGGATVVAGAGVVAGSFGSAGRVVFTVVSGGGVVATVVATVVGKVVARVVAKVVATVGGSVVGCVVLTGAGVVGSSLGILGKGSLAALGGGSFCLGGFGTASPVCFGGGSLAPFLRSSFAFSFDSAAAACPPVGRPFGFSSSAGGT